MRSLKLLGLAFLAATALTGGRALANVCQADNNLWCATTMPVGGYCECSTHGQTSGGEVLARAPQGAKINSTAGGCGDHPNAPGCHR
jgi:hypothetical protein